MKGALTVFESSRGPLAKTYRLNGQGELEKGVAAQLTAGSYIVRQFGDVHELALLIQGLTTRQAISASLPADGSEAGRVVVQSALSSSPGALSRTKQHFSLQDRPGLLYIDHDCADSTTALSRRQLWALLVRAVPALATAGALWLPSGSSHVCHGDQDLTKLRGQHVYVLIDRASDAARVVKALAARLWLLGYGSIAVSKAGSLLVRCPIDLAPSDSARLVFAAGSECAAPLHQQRGAPVVLSDGGFLDSSAVPDLSHTERGRLDALIGEAKAAKAAEAATARAAHRQRCIADRLPTLMTQGISAAEAEERIGRAVDAAYSGVLLGDFTLQLVNEAGEREAVTVDEVLRDRERYEHRDLLDPLNPSHRNWSPDARLYLMSASPIAYSFDGNKVYRLRRQIERIEVSRGARSELIDSLLAALAQQDDIAITDAGPVQIVGDRLVPLTASALMVLAGHRVALFNRTKGGGSAAADLTRETADLVLSQLHSMCRPNN